MLSTYRLSTSLMLCLLACRDHSAPPPLDDYPPRDASVHLQPAMRPSDDMLEVAAGAFVATPLRCVPGTFDAGRQPPDPVHGVATSGGAFEIDREAVTCGNYVVCAKAGACPELPSDRCLDERATVPHAGAIAYCVWRGLQVATYAQWQRAARGVSGRPRPEKYDPAMECEAAHPCAFTSELGMVYTLEGRSSPEWTRDLDCSKPGSRERWPVRIDLDFGKLNDAAPSRMGVAAFRCSRDGG